MEPFGELRHDIRVAQLMEFYYAAQGGNRSGKKMYLSDFVLNRDYREAMKSVNVGKDIAQTLDLMAARSRRAEKANGA